MLMKWLIVLVLTMTYMCMPLEKIIIDKPGRLQVIDSTSVNYDLHVHAIGKKLSLTSQEDFKL